MAIVDGYATLQEVKAELRLGTTTDDAAIERAVEAASRLIDNATRRKFTTTAPGVARVFRGWGTTVWTDDASAVTLVEESSDQTSWATVPTSSYVTNPRPPIRSLVRTSGGDWATFVRITGTWGTATIPPEVHSACIIQATRLLSRSKSPEGVLAGEWGAARLARIDPDVLALVRPLARKVIG